MGIQKGLASTGKLVLLVLVAGLVAAFFLLDLDRFASLDYLKGVHGEITGFVASHPVQSSALYFVIYVLVTGLSLPGAAVMTLAGGAIFGLLWGLVLVSFASSIGATVAMLIARTLLRDWVQEKFADALSTVNAGMERDGAFYLFGLRMVPLFPFFVINVVMGLTPVSTWRFYWVSQVGMLAGTVVFVFAGTQLAQVQSVSDVLSPGLIAALSLLGLFPLLARKVLEWLQRARQVHD
ncbi:MAG: TVP38/TMEM64 family protein [Pseudomonadales bacterium]